MKDNKHGFSTGLVLTALAIIILILAVGWLVYRRQHPHPKTVDAVLQQITTDAQRTYGNVAFAPTNPWSAEMSAPAFHAVPGYDYGVSDAGKSIFFAFQNDNKSKTVKNYVFFSKTLPAAHSTTEVKKWVGGRLASYGFTTVDHTTYTRSGISCGVLSNGAVDGKDTETNVVQVRCYSKESLTAAAARMKPFVDAYMQHHPGLSLSDITVGPLTIKSQNGSGVIGSSHTAGYDIAELLVSTKAKKTQIALFYAKNADIQKGTNSGWHYVTEANDEFGFKCAAMKADPDARAAFYDQICYTPQGQVRLDSNSPALQ